MRRCRKIKFFLFVIGLFALFLWANFVFAEEGEAGRELEVQYPTLPGAVAPTTIEETQLPGYVKYAFNFAIIIAGLVAFGVLVWGGVRYLTSAGDPTKLSDAKDQIFAAFLGLIVLLSSYLILTTINPQLKVIEISEIAKVEIVPATPILNLENLFSSINVELPLGPIVEDRIFPEERMKRIKKITADTENTATESIKPGKSLACLTVRDKDACKEAEMSANDPTIGCFCDKGCVEPICIESCCCEVTEDGACVSCSCGKCGCSSDPCCKPRDKISENENLLQEKVGVFLALQKKSNTEARELRIEVDKLQKSLQIMQECPLWGINSMSEFISLKDDYEKQNWKLKKINYWDYINAKLNPVTFYCPVGGTMPSYAPKSEIPPEEMEKFSEDFEKSLQGGEMLIYCQKPIPFGEIIDKTIVVANKLIKKIEELVELNQKMVSAIDHLTQLVDQCTSKNCSCSCGCGKGCSCKPSPCSGDPCPPGVPEAAEEIKKIKEEIAAKRTEIDKIIDEEVPPVLKELKKVKESMYLCISEMALEEEVEPAWLLLDCSRAVGNIAPDGEKIKDTEGCPCKKDDECKKEFELVKDYQCQEINECYLYNFFCCRAKD